MDIKEYIKKFNLSFDRIKTDFGSDFNSLYQDEEEWLGNFEDKIHLLNNKISEEAIQDIIQKLKNKIAFNENDTSNLSIFVTKVNTIVRIANRINNFKDGTLLNNGSKLKLSDFFNSVALSNNLKTYEYSLNDNLNNFLPHIYSVIKHCQKPNEYPIYYKFWKNIQREVLNKNEDYDSMCSFYISFPIENRHLNFGSYFGTIGIQIAKNINQLGIELTKDSKEYKFLTNDVINIDRYSSILNDFIGFTKQYYLVGAFWDGSDPEDQTSRFVENGIWENGYDDKFIEKVNAVPIGSEIAIKAAFTRGKTKSVMAIKAKGTVLENNNDGKNLVIEWDKNFTPFEVDFSGGYWDTIKEVTNKEHIRIIFHNDTNEITTNQTIQMNFPLNTILYGPPGTGKTYNTVLRAAEIIENRKISSYDEALTIFKNNLHNRIEFITFHQNYCYEDFIQGLRPDTENDKELTFEKRDGVFKVIADKALENIKLSEKATDELTNEAMFISALEELKEKIIDSNEKIRINDTAYFTAVEDNAFRYSGDNWTLNDKGFSGFRMKYSDLIRFNEEKISERKQIKEISNISGLAKQHASYFFKAYEIVKSLIKKNITTPLRVPKQNYVIIIDEINRANISRVFGELITLIEPDKRSHGAIPLEAKLPSGDIFKVPSNLYIIGTMNTADKSIALLDIALRRRFDFESLYPLYEIDGVEIYDKDILIKINEQIIKSKGHDFQIGHAYFMDDNKDLIQRMNKKVIPLLLEYFMNDEKEVKGILYNAGLQVEENSWPIKISGKRA